MSDEETKAERAATARQWLLEHHVGVLGTTMGMKRLAGHPYSSVVPFAVDAIGRPLILIADIATHTANLSADPRGSLIVRQPGLEGDPQKGWRITLLGSWAPLDGDDAEDANVRYLERVPAARSYRRTHGFRFWRMAHIEAVRFIGGFGEISWLEGAAMLRDPMGGGLSEAAPGAIAHMNDDHGGNLIEMVQGRYGTRPQAAEMTAMDRTGFRVRTTGPDDTHQFSFGTEIDATTLRRSVIDVLTDCRAQLQAGR